MKLKKLLVFLSMVFCLASEAKAQFYDSADDIYYYVNIKSDGTFGPFSFIFNFDGKNGCVLSEGANDDDARYPLLVDDIKRKLSQNTEK